MEETEEHKKKVWNVKNLPADEFTRDWRSRVGDVDYDVSQGLNYALVSSEGYLPIIIDNSSVSDLEFEEFIKKQKAWFDRLISQYNSAADYSRLDKLKKLRDEAQARKREKVAKEAEKQLDEEERIKIASKMYAECLEYDFKEKREKKQRNVSQSVREARSLRMKKMNAENNPNKRKKLPVETK